MKKLLILVLLFPPLAHGEGYAFAGLSYREESYTLGVGYVGRVSDTFAAGVELEFADCGRQPAPHDNINRMLIIAAVGFAEVSPDWAVFWKFGKLSTRYSHNGENDYRADGSFKGYATTAGIEWKAADRLRVQLQVSSYQYQQANNPNMGGWTRPSLNVRYLF